MAGSDKTSVASETLAEHRRWTRSALVLAVISAALALGFFSLSRTVSRGATGDLDERILLAMRVPENLADPVGPRWVEEVGRDFTALGGVAVLGLITATLVSFFWLSSMRRAAIYVGIASLLAKGM